MIIFFLSCYFPIWRTKKKEANYWDCFLGGGRRRWEVATVFCLTRAGLLERIKGNNYYFILSSSSAGRAVVVFQRDMLFCIRSTFWGRRHPRATWDGGRRRREDAFRGRWLQAKGWFQGHGGQEAHGCLRDAWRLRPEATLFLRAADWRTMQHFRIWCS